MLVLMACSSFSQMPQSYRDGDSPSHALSPLATSVFHILWEEQSKTGPFSGTPQSFPVTFLSKSGWAQASQGKSPHRMSPDSLPALEEFDSPPELFDYLLREW